MHSAVGAHCTKNRVSQGYGVVFCMECTCYSDSSSVMKLLHMPTGRHSNAPSWGQSVGFAVMLVTMHSDGADFWIGDVKVPGAGFHCEPMLLTGALPISIEAVVMLSCK